MQQREKELAVTNKKSEEERKALLLLERQQREEEEKARATEYDRKRIEAEEQEEAERRAMRAIEELELMDDDGKRTARKSLKQAPSGMIRGFWKNLLGEEINQANANKNLGEEDLRMRDKAESIRKKKVKNKN